MKARNHIKQHHRRILHWASDGIGTPHSRKALGGRHQLNVVVRPGALISICLPHAPFPHVRWVSSLGTHETRGIDDGDDHDNIILDDDSYANFDDGNEPFLDERFPAYGNSKAKKAKNNRMFDDINSLLEERVSKFVNTRLGELQPHDVVLAAEHLIRQSCKRKSFEGMKMGHDILDRILEEKHHFNAQRESDGRPKAYAIVIPEKIFEVLMYGWSNMSRKVALAPQRMREILDMMIREAEYDETVRLEREKEGFVAPSTVKGKKPTDMNSEELFARLSCQPTVGIYNTLLGGLAQASYRSIASANEAEDLLRQMERTARKQGWHVKPNTKSFMAVINAYSRSKHPSCGDRAEEVLRRMIRYHEHQLEVYEEEIGYKYDSVNLEQNIRRVVTPDIIAYTATIQAHSESDAPGSAEKALRLLTEVLGSSHPSLKEDPHIYAATINAFAKRAAKEKGVRGRLESAQSAEEILWLMVDRLLGAEVIDSNYVVPFNTTLLAWANANVKESPTRARAILQKMLAPESMIRPNVATFNSCMQVWARSARQDNEAPKHAEDLLQLMEQVDDVEPDIVSFTTVISAYAKSNRPDKGLQARRVLEILLANLGTMASRDKISSVPFTVVLNAISSATNGAAEGNGPDPFGLDDGIEVAEDLFTIALKTYDELALDLYEFGIAPDHLAFSSMIDVIGRYTNPNSIERRQRIEKIFHDACTAGCVSNMVVEAMRKACPSEEMFLNLLELPSWPVRSRNALPREWIRKVPPQFKLRTKSNPRNRNGGKRSDS